jgi:hypothetical protein
MLRDCFRPALAEEPEEPSKAGNVAPAADLSCKSALRNCISKFERRL